MVSGGLAERSIATDCKFVFQKDTVVQIHQPPPRLSLSLTGSARTLLIVGNVTFDSDLKGPKYPTHIEWCGKESRDSVVGSLAKSRDG